MSHPATVASPVAPTPATAAARPGATAQYLTFSLAGESFAIGILSIKEIIEYGELTEVPMMPGCVRGVINLRGTVVPVVDLLARFGKPSSPIGKRTCIVIVEVHPLAEAAGPRQVIGVLVDAVSEVLSIAPDDIEPPPVFGSRIRSDFIDGVGKVKGRFVIVLGVDRVLSLDDISAAGTAAIGASVAETASSAAASTASPQQLAVAA